MPDRLCDDPEDADPGLAGERTEMAWLRSSLSFAAVGIAVLKIRPELGASILAFSAVVWSIGHLPRAHGAKLARRRALLVTVAVTAMAAAALTLVLLGRAAPGLRL